MQANNQKQMLETVTDKVKRFPAPSEHRIREVFTKNPKGNGGSSKSIDFMLDRIHAELKSPKEKEAIPGNAAESSQEQANEKFDYSEEVEEVHNTVENATDYESTWKGKPFVHVDSRMLYKNKMKLHIETAFETVQDFCEDEETIVNYREEEDNKFQTVQEIKTMKEDKAESEKGQNSKFAEEPQDFNIVLLGQKGVGKSTYINVFANYATYKDFQKAIDGKIVAPIPTLVQIKDDEYKEHKINPAQLGTPSPKSYVFPCKDIRIRIIDTPGIGNPEGIDADKTNIAGILDFIARFEHLHAICILLRPNEPVDYCLKEFLSNIDKGKAKNIIFAFTNANKSDPIWIESILKVTSKFPAHIPLNSENIYSFNNDSFAFLSTHEKGAKFNESSKSTFRTNWNQARDECERMTTYIQKLPPCKTTQISAIKESRIVIPLLSKIQDSLTQNIKKKMDALNRQNVIKNKMLLVDSKISTELYNKLIGIYKLQRPDLEVVEEIRECNKESVVVSKAIEEFVRFLQQNAIVFFNDACEDRLNGLIKKEKSTRMRDLARIAAFEDMLRRQQELKKIFEGPAKKSGAQTPNLDDFNILEKLKELFGLAKIGDELETLYKSQKSERLQEVEYLHKSRLNL